jgi:hypothetical protein
MHHNEYLSHLSTSVAHRTKKGHFLKGPPKQRALGIAEVVTLQFAATCTYTFLIIAAAGHPNSLTGQLLKGGIVATGQVLGLLFGSPLALRCKHASP